MLSWLSGSAAPFRLSEQLKLHYVLRNDGQLEFLIYGVYIWYLCLPMRICMQAMWTKNWAFSFPLKIWVEAYSSWGNIIFMSVHMTAIKTLDFIWFYFHKPIKNVILFTWNVILFAKGWHAHGLTVLAPLSFFVALESGIVVRVRPRILTLVARLVIGINWWW